MLNYFVDLYVWGILINLPLGKVEGSYVNVMATRTENKG